MRHLFVLFLIFMLIGCNYINTGSLSVSVEHQGQPVANTLVTLFSFENSNKNWIKIGEQKTDRYGKVKWNLNFYKIQSIKITAQNMDLENIYFPSIKYTKNPQWWQDHELSLKMNLEKFQAKLRVKSKSNMENQIGEQNSGALLDFPDDPLSQSISIGQIESNLPPEKNIENNKFAFHLATPTLLEKSFLPDSLQSKSPPKSSLITITENKNVLFEDNLTLEVFFQGKPQDNVHVFSGRNATQYISYIGVTDSKGILSFSMPHQSRSDTLIIKKASFLTQVRPLTPGSGKQNLRIDLLEGKSTDFILQSYAYGVGRGMDKTELKSNSLRVDIAGMTGFVTTNKALDEKVILSLEQKNAFPNVIDFKVLKKCLELHTFVNQIPTLYVSSLLPYKPSVGLIEPSLNSQLQTNAVWRRVRREFFSRFMNEPLMRGIIPDDIVRMSNKIGVSPLEMATTGWKNSIFSEDLDMLLQIQYVESEEGKGFSLAGKVFDKTGKIIMERVLPVVPEEAEKISAKMYSSLVSSLPVEGNVVKKNKNEVTINLGKNFGISEGDKFVTFIQKYPFSPPEKPIGILKVKSVGDKESIAEIELGKEKINTVDVIRVTRYPDKMIQQDLQSQIANSL
ncbi:hypothetical protein [Silvanigrella aquatica]|uniref:Uncharacterized protein n=1 Tax=Silvanigrella aquatica TaxID=1915309 RepID=A0A1L4CZZ5_9BACT|nr:hypothetical protein [Silvanigrella aquatica]APJ03518.1 hypothetical protein AXG55_06195 [Silvanigrella aquatica]